MPRNAALTKGLAETTKLVPTSPPPHPTPPTPQSGETFDVEINTAVNTATGKMAGSFKRAPHHARQTVRPEYAAFADALRAAMLKKNLNASEVARRIWGTTKDGRGYDVARNRDRIGHYLAGTSYPETENLQLLADALGLTVEDLAVDRPVVVPLRGRQTAPVQITVLGDQPTHARLQIDSVVPWNLAIEIVAMVQNRLHGSDDDEPTAPTAA